MNVFFLVFLVYAFDVTKTSNLLKSMMNACRMTFFRSIHIIKLTKAIEPVGGFIAKVHHTVGMRSALNSRKVVNVT